jgi:EAL and modified HD-GYP domain-containing signal transduction protein
MDAFLARQPIFDRELQVYGYERLFRNGTENYFRPIDGDAATSSLISDAMHVHSLDKLTDGRRSFIHFTRNAVIQDLYTVLPAATTVVEVLESVELDDELLDACRRVKSRGYTLALDDYILESRFDPLLSLIDVLKTEFPALSETQQHRVIASARQHGFKLLAEKVETPDQYEFARHLGYDYFQGYFFCKPQLVSARRLPESGLQCL